MNRPGAILIPMLGGFLLTAAVVSWRSGWWQRRTVLESPAATAVRVAARKSALRIVQTHVTAGFPAIPAAAPASLAAVPAPPLPAAASEQESAPYEPPPVPRTDPGNSPERLDASARKFAHGSRAEEN